MSSSQAVDLLHILLQSLIVDPAFVSAIWPVVDQVLTPIVGTMVAREIPHPPGAALAHPQSIRVTGDGPIEAKAAAILSELAELIYSCRGTSYRGALLEKMRSSGTAVVRGLSNVLEHDGRLETHLLDGGLAIEVLPESPQVADRRDDEMGT